ncbi:MAG: hypothetical protein J5599_02405 [Spirochaetales bacterium]|nr:hypothetical protein [Spirochaetales bacterium]
MNRRVPSIILSILIACIALVFITGCSSVQYTCYYAYFGDCAYAMIYTPSTNSFYCIQLPLEQILRWGKASGLDSIPIAMRNYVGLKDSGFLIGNSDSLRTIRDILDVLGSESDDIASNEKRVQTMVRKAQALSKKPLSDKINQLSGQDAESLLKLLAEKNPDSWCYDAHSFFNSDDLNFSQRYFTEWLEQVLGGNK